MQPPNPEGIPQGRPPKEGVQKVYFMGPHWGDEGGLVFKDPSLQGGTSLPAQHVSLMPACPVLFSPRQAHPHPSLYTAAGEGVGGSHFNGSLPETPNLFCPQLAKLIVPFSTRSQHWLTGFQSPLLPNYR